LDRDKPFLHSSSFQPSHSARFRLQKFLF
jgi:hypothetical protein